MGFSSRNTGVGCHFLLQEFSWPRDQTRSPAFQADSLPSEPPGKLNCNWDSLSRSFSFAFLFLSFSFSLWLCLVAGLWSSLLSRLFLVVSRSYSLLQCIDLSLWSSLLLWSMGSRHACLNSCGLQALECGLTSCGTQALVAPQHVAYSWTRIKPMSPALAGGFLTSGPSGKPLHSTFKREKSPSKAIWY